MTELPNAEHLISDRLDLREFPSLSEGGGSRWGAITIESSRLFISVSPHPAPLPQEEREFPEKNKLEDQTERTECLSVFVSASGDSELELICNWEFELGLIFL